MLPEPSSRPSAEVLTRFVLKYSVLSTKVHFAGALPKHTARSELISVPSNRNEEWSRRKRSFDSVRFHPSRGSILM
jgi:hypothetical protein